MTDRLRDLLDLVLGSLDDPGTDGPALARRAHFSRDHLDRLLGAATGESPTRLRRRLLLERAAWQLRTGAASPTAVAPAAGFGSLAAFSRAFTRAYGLAPSAFAAAAEPPVWLDAPNGIHFHPPAGVLVPSTAPGPPPGDGDLVLRLVAHHIDRVRALLRAAATLPDEALDRPLRPGFQATWFEGEEASAALMIERLAWTLEVWVAAMAGQPPPEAPAPDDPARPTPLDRFEAAGAALLTVVRAIHARHAWDDAFVDALCEPPESFTYAGVISHVLTYGAVRREMLASVLAELGADLGPAPGIGDPILWERARLAGRDQPSS